MGSTENAGFNVIIVGGGIAGLAAATGLAQNGNTVTVLESKPSLNEFGASIGITANGVRPLKAWGLQSAFEKVVTKNKFLDVRDGTTNEMIGHIPHNKNNASLIGYGEEIWNINRRDFQETLAHAAEESGAKIVFGAELARVDVEGCIVHLKDGRSFSGDLIIGADGISSTTRQSIPAVSHVGPVPDATGAFRCTVPKEKIRGNPKLEWLLESGNEYVFLAPGQYVLSWPLPDNKSYDVVVSAASCDDVPPGRWGVKGNPDEVRKDCAHFCPEIVELLSHLDTCVKWRIAELPPIETCRSENGRVVLIGDAWHAMLPHAASGGNSAIEDAASLTTALTWASQNHKPLPLATSAFESLRTPRVRRMQAACHEGVQFLESADPEFIAFRNGIMAEATKAYDEHLALPESMRKGMEKAEPDMEARFPTEPYLQWLYNYDVIAKTEAYLGRI